jgi:tyrosinase
MTPAIYTSKPIDISGLDADFYRADLEFHDIEHDGASYQARVFVNNPDARRDTPRDAASGYAGAFHVFGHGGCYGAPGHCDLKVPRPHDPRPGHPLTRAKKIVIATDAIRHARQTGDTMTITIVPIITGGTKKCDFTDVVKLHHINVKTYADV